MITEIDIAQLELLVGNECALRTLESADKIMLEDSRYTTTLQWFDMSRSDGEHLYIIIDMHVDKETGLTMIDKMYASDVQMPDEMLDEINKKKATTERVSPGTPVVFETKRDSIWKNSENH